MTQTNFQALGLAAALQSALAIWISPRRRRSRRSDPGRDEGARRPRIAQTGTGKTAAFSLPILDALLNKGGKSKPSAPRVLILAPTRELAVQIAENIKGFTAGTPIRHMTVFGGVSIRPQIDTARRGCRHRGGDPRPPARSQRPEGG